MVIQRARMTVPGALGVLWILAGCTADIRVDHGPDEIPGTGDALDSFFGIEGGIHDVEIDLDDDAYQSLVDDPYQYVEAAITIDGERLDSVAVRLKGNAGSFVRIDATEFDEWKPPKPAFIVDFNRYVDGQEYLGLQKLTLNNLAQDPSGIREFMGYSLFRAGQVPSSRSGWGVVSVNDERKGLYVLLEAVDNDVFLDSWYGTDQGNIYEGEYDVDLETEQVDWFEQDNGDDESRSDLRQLAEALDEVGEDDDGHEVLQRYFDLESYLVFSTTELYLGHWDGYAWSVNNYRIHHHPDTDVWTFLPWGIDQLFEDEMGDHAGVIQEPGPSWPWGGRVHEICVGSPGCRQQLHDAHEATMDRAVELDLQALADEAWDLVGDEVWADAERFGTEDWTEETLDVIGWYLDERRDQMEVWLPCLVGGSVDHDGDGYCGCTEDCRDHDPQIHPDAEETCNFVDDDCNGVLDDPKECPRCQDVTGHDGREYALCIDPMSWDDAHQYCLDQDQDLASLHDETTWEELGWEFAELAEAWETWIGLTDRDSEGEFVWTDGSDLDLELWYEDEAQEWGDCVINTLWGWWASECEHELPFMCKSP